MFLMCKLSVCIILSCVYNGLAKSQKPTSGPYISYAKSVSNCTKTTYPLDPNPTILMDLVVYNTSKDTVSLKGSFNVLKYTTHVKVSVKSYIWERGKWKMNYILPAYGCPGTLLPLMLSIAQIKFDRKKCAFLEGRTPLDIANPNKMHHLIASTAEYGKFKFIHEMIKMGKHYTTFFCHEFITVIEPV